MSSPEQNNKKGLTIQSTRHSEQVSHTGVGIRSSGTMSENMRLWGIRIATPINFEQSLD